MKKSGFTIVKIQTTAGTQPRCQQDHTSDADQKITIKHNAILEESSTNTTTTTFISRLKEFSFSCSCMGLLALKFYCLCIIRFNVLKSKLILEGQHLHGGTGCAGARRVRMCFTPNVNARHI